MPIHITEAYTLTLAMRILELRTRFMRYGIMTVEEYDKARVGVLEEPLVYDPITLDDDGMYTVYAGYRGCSRHQFFEDIYVRFSPGDTRDEDFIEVAVPVVDDDDCDTCKDCNCGECPHIHSYQLYLIGRDGCISEDVEMLDDDECCCGCCDCEDCDCDAHEDTPTAAHIMHCRESGEHNLCNCECGEEHCFVECGPDSDAECDLNENGRCHCPHNRCCGCDCECEPDEEE